MNLNKEYSLTSRHSDDDFFEFTMRDIEFSQFCLVKNILDHFNFRAKNGLKITPIHSNANFGAKIQISSCPNKLHSNETF